MSYDLDQLTLPLKVTERIVETPEAVSLTFTVPPEQAQRYRFQPGQFVTLFLETDGEVLPRSYSICSSPAIEKELKVTIKRVPGGRGSNFICDKIKVGDQVRVSPPSGRFYQPAKSPGPHHYFLAAAGSGITPIFSILKTVLLTEPQAKVTLIYGNRKLESIIYAKEIRAWQERMGDRLIVHHVLSQPPADWNGFSGRCEGTLLQGLLLQTIPKSKDQFEAYICGPTAFMAAVQEGLKARGLTEAQIHTESFVTATPSAGEKPADDANATYIGNAQAAWNGKSAAVEVHLSGETIQLSIPADQTILEGLIAHGANPPYSCLEGNCMACVAKVRSGRVVQRDPGILLDENIAQGEVLTCQARPAANQVKIDYDSI